MMVVVLMEDLNRVVNNADLVADSRNILGNLRKSHFSRFAASVCFQNDVVCMAMLVHRKLWIMN